MIKVILLAVMFSNLENLTPGKAAFIIFFALAIMLVSLRINLKYSKRHNKNEPYRRRISSPYSRNIDRDDDLDIPSGFGGPSGYGVIRQDDSKNPSDGD